MSIYMEIIKKCGMLSTPMINAGDEDHRGYGCLQHVPYLAKFIFRWIGFMHSCTTSWTSASSLFPVFHYWTNL